MAITATWRSKIGAGGSIGGDLTGTTIVFGADNDDAASAAANPITAGANSIRRYLLVRFTETAGTDSTIDNLVIDRSDSNGSGTNLDGQGTTVDAQAGLTYAENSSVALTSITELGASGSGTIAPTIAGTTLNSGGTASIDCQDFAVQVDTSATATAGVSFTLRCSFDITA